MRGRLFWKIWLGFWGTFLLLSYGLWLYWSLRPMPSLGEWDAPYEVGRVLIASAATALERGGPSALERQIADWPEAERARLTVRLGVSDCAPGQDRELAVSVHAGGEGHCLRYAPPPPPEDESFLAMPPDDLVATALAGLAFSAALAWYLTRPIHQLRAGFNQLAEGRFAVRLGGSMGRRRDEIADLAGDFDRMAERLAELVAARDRLLHDVSHELRSPLARMRLAIGLLRRDPGRFDASLERIDREADHIDAIVGELLTLARLESGIDKDGEYFDLVEVLALVLEDVTFEAETQTVRVETSLPRAVPDQDWLVAGSGLLIRRAVENILRNALRFSPKGQVIHLRLARDGQDCLITVEDNGPGIGAATPSSLLQPFARDRSGASQGHGLGLAIAERAIAACGGTLELTNRTPTGLLVTIRLPLAGPGVSLT
ncbi:MAG: HAMP domain-containing protein [Caulobacter sp.]|nr:HAMP domain-containing protein [Rhodospirillum sp.]MCF8491442.1 HAMP domain-containing protein [Rhodospirillum sp.]MCF8506935.1 HAMP domain-containing protein [Caulobacter sp.]